MLFNNEAYDETLVKAAQAFISHAEEVRGEVILVNLSSS